MVNRASQWNSAPEAWTKAVLERRPVRLVTVALVNKKARITWALITCNEVYRAKGHIMAAAGSCGVMFRRQMADAERVLD
jgi:transposase